MLRLRVQLRLVKCSFHSFTLTKSATLNGSFYPMVEKESRGALWNRFNHELEQQIRQEISEELEGKYIERFEKWKENYKRNLFAVAKEKLRHHSEVFRHSEKEECRPDSDREEDVNDLMELTEERHVPAILHPQIKYMLPQITSMLNLKSISRLLRASSELFSMGDNGMIKAPVNMCLETYRSIDVYTYAEDWEVYTEEDKGRRAAVLLYKGKALTCNQIWQIQKANWITTTLENLNLYKFPNAEENMWDLLEMAHVERINDADFHFVIDLNRFLEKYKVPKLKCRLLEKNELFNPLLLQVGDINFSCEEVVDDDTFLKFTRLSVAHCITFLPQLLSVKVVPTIIHMWLKGERRFNYVRFDIPEEEDLTFGQIDGIRNEEYRFFINDYSYRWVLKDRDLSIPVAIHSGISALIIRGDQSVLLAYCEESSNDTCKCHIRVVE